MAPGRPGRAPPGPASPPAPAPRGTHRERRPRRGESQRPAEPPGTGVTGTQVEMVFLTLINRERAGTVSLAAPGAPPACTSTDPGTAALPGCGSAIFTPGSTWVPGAAGRDAASAAEEPLAGSCSGRMINSNRPGQAPALPASGSPLGEKGLKEYEDQTHPEQIAAAQRPHACSAGLWLPCAGVTRRSLRHHCRGTPTPKTLLFGLKKQQLLSPVLSFQPYHRADGPGQRGFFVQTLQNHFTACLRSLVGWRQAQCH